MVARIDSSEVASLCFWGYPSRQCHHIPSSLEKVDEFRDTPPHLICSNRGGDNVN